MNEVFKELWSGIGMRTRYSMFFSVGMFVGIISCLVASCSTINKKLGLKDDGFIEETAEAVLKAKTNIDLDFTPETPEAK